MSLFSVNASKQIIDPAGGRFIVRGVTMFDYLLVSYEPRTNYAFRQTGGTAPSAGVSRPTWHAKAGFKNPEFVQEQLNKAKASGINLIRVAVEPAMLNASVAYIEGGIEYPSDMDMLNCIIDKATALGIVTQLQNGNDSVPIALSVSFLKTLSNLYAGNSYVWINPANELNGANGSGLVNDVNVWRSTMTTLVNAVRASGSFKNPIVINPPHFGEDLAGVSAFILGDSAFNNDPCLIIGVHLYPQKGEYDFRTTRLPAEQLSWYRFRKLHCIFVDEVGLDNYAGRYDPAIDPAIGSQDLIEFERMKSWGLDFLDWAWQQSVLTETLNGVTGISWYAYIPGMLQHDDNTMYRQDGTSTAWGNIFKNYTLRKGKIMELPADMVWQNYTPTFSASSGVMVSATSQGRFTRVGDVCFFKAYLAIANIGNAGGELIVGLPTLYGNPAGISSPVTAMQIVNDFAMFGRTNVGSPTVKLKKYDGSFPGASGAQYIVSGCFEVAPL
jgi:hypothetical protein